MAFDFQQWANENLRSSGQQQQPVNYGNQPAWMGGMQNYYNQVQQANRQLQQEQESSWLDKSRDNADGYKYRQMNDVDRFFGGLNSLTNTLSGGASEALGLGTFNPDEGFTPENIGRFVVNLPGQLLSSVPDAAVHAAEVISGTPYTEADFEKGIIPDYEMGLDQRAASLGYLGLDVLGFIPGLGPEARAAGLAAKGLGAGARVVGRETAADAIEVAGRLGSAGAVKNMGTLETAARLGNAGSGTLKAAKVGDSVIDTAVSAGFEGFQEAGQNMFEDLRYRQWDDQSFQRAATAGAWGALGGGLVGGVSNVANAFGDKLASDPVTDPQQNTSPEFEREKQRNQVQMSGDVTASAAQRLAELARKNNDLPGSSSLLSTVINSDLDLTQAGIGENAIHSILQADDNGESIKAIADKFGVTVDVITAIDSIESSAERAKEYNKLLENARRAGTPITVVIGRNPDTSLGTALFELDNVYDGDGVYMNRSAYMMYGGDVDGDKNQVYFSNLAQHNGYLTNNLLSAATGKSRLNADYIAFGNTNEMLDSFDASIDALFANSDVSQQTIDYFKRSYRGCFDESKIDADKVSKLFDDIRATLFRANANNQLKAGAQQVDTNKASYDADKAVAGLMHNLEQRSIMLPQKFTDVVSKMSLEDQKAAQVLYGTIADIGDKYLRSGDTAGGRHFADFAAQLGYKIANNTDLGNPFFRQAGQVYYHAQEDQNMWFGGMPHDDVVNVYEQLIAFSFRLSEVGGDVENSIEGIWRTTVQDETIQRLHDAGWVKADVSGGWNALLEVFAKVHDDRVDTFNSALETQTTRIDSGFSLNTATKKKLSSTDSAVRDRAIAREFMEVFGEYYVNDLLDISESNYFYGKTFNQAIGEQASGPGRWNGSFRNYEEFSQFWKTLLEDYGGKQNAIGVKVQKTISDVAYKIRVISDHTFIDDNGKVNVEPAYMDIMSEVVDSLNILMGPDSALNLNLATVDSFINTEWGKALMSGDEDRMSNALLSIWLTDQYQYAIDIVVNEDIENDTAALNRFIAETAELANNSPLHMAIYYEAKKGHVGFLRGMTDLDVSYQQKLSLFEDLTADNYGNNNLLAAALHTSDSEMSVSSVSERLKRVDRVMSRAMRRTREYNQQVIATIDDNIDMGMYSVGNAVAAMREFSKQEYMQFSSDAIASFVYSQRDIVKDMVDKGVAPRSADILYQQAANIWQGGNLSYLDQMGIQLGNMSVGNFQTNRIQILRVLNDPTAEIRCWDPTKDGYAYLTQKSLFKEYGIDIDENGATDTQYWEFMHQAPQIASIIAPSKLDVVSDGSSTIVTPGTAIRLDAAIKQYKANREQNNRQLSERRYRNQVKQTMFQDPNWWGLLIASTPGIEEDITLAETMKIVNDSIERHTDFFMAYAASGNGEDFKLAREAYYRDMFATLLDQAADVMNSVDIVGKYVSLTGSVQASLANDASMGMIGLYKTLAVKKLFDSKNVPFDISSAVMNGVSDYDVASFTQSITDHAQTYLDLAYALMNMADSTDLSFDSFMKAGLWDTEINSQIAELRKTDPQKAQEISDEIDSWGNGLSGFMTFMTGQKDFSVSKDLGNLVITDDAFMDNDGQGWTASQWETRCKAILEKYGKMDDWDDVKSPRDIRRAIEDNDLQRIKSYYNNVIVSSIMQDMTFGSALTVNIDAMKQTIDAKKQMIALADKIKGQIGDKIESVSTPKFPQIDFRYSSTAVSYMATSGIMNAQSGSVGSGIGIDGQMTKLISAFAALPADHDCGVMGERMSPSQVNVDDHLGWNYTDIDGNLRRIRSPQDVTAINRIAAPEVVLYNPAHCLSWTCSKCSPASRSSSNPKINLVAYALSELANWMQEARHLQAKKKIGFASLISDGIEPRSDLSSPMKFVPGESNDAIDSVRLGLMDALYARRSELATFWNQKFDEAGSDLPLDMDHAIAFSNAMTPVVEVMLDDDMVVYVSAHDLADPAIFSAKYGEMLTGNITACRPVVMSLQEVSSKIIRGISQEYYKPENIGNFSKQDVHDSAIAAVENWDSYNTNKLSVRDIIDGIVPYGSSFVAGMTADATPSVKLRWNDKAYGSIKRLLSKSDYSIRLASDNYVKNALAAKISMDAAGFPKNRLVMRYASNGTTMNTLAGRVLRHVQVEDNSDGNQAIIKAEDGSQLIAVEMFDTNEAAPTRETLDQAREAHNRAMKNGRPIIMPFRVFEAMREDLTDEEYAYATSFAFQGKEYVEVDPNVIETIRSYRGDFMQMATEFMSPDEITIAMADFEGLQLPDGGHYTRRDYQPKYTYQGSARLKASSLLRGFNPISIVTNFDEIKNIRQDDIDYSYYEGLQGEPDISVRRNAVDAFIREASGLDGDYMTLKNVTRDSCVGFVKQQQGASTIYAPVFYTGSIPSTATSVTMRMQNGYINLVYSTDEIDYNGNESMKLDLYGVAYKSVGHTVSQDMQDKFWGAIDDCGFNLVQSPEHMFDYHALASRVFSMSDSIVQNNLFYFSRKAGVNLFFNADGSRKVGLAKLTNDQLADLIRGSKAAWSKVANGSLKLFENVDGDLQVTAEMNDIIKTLTLEIMLNGGEPHLFFNSREFSIDPATGKVTDNGIVPRDMTFRMATKYLNRDKTLKLFHLLDSRLCPNGWEAGLNDDMKTVFDRSGKMINRNTKSGQPERVFALVGPHYYTGQGTAIGNLSRTASYSNQHMIKRMMELGVFPKKIDDLVTFLGMQTGDVSKFISEQTSRERLANRDISDHKVVLNQNMYDEVALSMNDPVRLTSASRYRNSLSSMLEELTHTLAITTDDLKTDAFTDAQAKRMLEDAVDSLNKALGNPDPRDKLTMAEVLELVRLETGFTENDGRGSIKSLTYNQVIGSINRMKKNLEEGSLIIKGGTYEGARGDVRGHIPLLPSGLSQRLMSMPIIKARYKKDVNAFIEDQYTELKEVTLPAIEKIENKSKKLALYRFSDAVCYANGKDHVSGHILDDVYMPDLIEAIKKWGSEGFANYDPEFAARYDELTQLNVEYVEKLKKLSEGRKSSVISDANGGRTIVFHGDDRTIGTYILRTLSGLRKTIGMSYAFMLPANITERFLNQGMQSIALTLGQTKLGPYASNSKVDPKIAKNAVKDADFKKLYVALRSAELVGADRDLLVKIRNGQDLDSAIKEVLQAKGAFERFQEKFMNVMSGHDIFIEGQMRNFIDRFAQRTEQSAPWWNVRSNDSNMTVLEQQLEQNPSKWFIDVLNGSSDSTGADMILARQCLNWAKRGDMAQKNVVSAIYSEFASRHAGFEFFTTAFVSPYFQYATNRLGRLMNWVAPISSIHYVVTDFLTNGAGKNIPIGRDMKFGDLALEDVQFQASLKEAVIIDILHLGPMLVGMMLIGMAGAIEPPEDEDKWGNFKEWTIFGQRVDVAWWLEDILGLALPVAVFGKSVQLGQPRLDLIVNGLAYYLGNNPVTKVADAVTILMDPMAELQQDYDKDLEGYAKAMGGPPQMTDMVNGKLTSMGLSFVSQFITPGFVREIYNGSQQFEPSYKRVYETDATGRLTDEAKNNNKTQYTTYQDAVVRKFTKNNPVMGLLADLIMQPTTGYMAHEMPDRIIYDPEQMNSIEAFSLYNDPWTKKDPKSSQEQLEVCLTAIAELQSKSVDQLYREGFILDYDTKVYVGKYLWDNIATLNEQWAELEKSGALNYYVAGNGNYEEGQKVVAELKQQHYNLISEIKSLYYDKLWADELKSPAQYNQLHTQWAQDDNGEWYATGYYPSWFLPITLAPTETQGGYQYVMSREEDWDTESIVTGDSTGQRGLVPREVGKVATPNIESWSQDGTSTGHSDIYGSNNADDTASGKTTYPTTSYPRSSGSSGGSGGSGGRGGSSAPNAYAPSISLPRANAGRIMNTDKLVQPSYEYLRPDFETKGSREAYRRSDI